MLLANMGFGVTRRGGNHAQEVHMLSTLLVLFLVLWLLGVVSSYTAGGFIHVLPAVVILVVLMRVIQGRRPIGGSSPRQSG